MDRYVREVKFIAGIVLLLLFQSCGSTSTPLPEFEIYRDRPLQWDDKIDTRLVYSDAERRVDFVAGIKYRGGMSSRYYKHSYTVELDRKYMPAGLPRDDDWVLNANYIDKTFMRHKISYDLFRAMSWRDTAPRCAYVNLQFDSAYVGLYVLMEKVNAGFLELEKEDTTAVLFKDPPLFYRERTVEAEDSLNYYEQKFPDIEKRDKTWYIERFKAFLFDSDDSTFAAKIGTWIDVKNVIDWHILLLFSNNGDGIMKNFYLYKKDADTPFRIAIWDYDHSFGRDGDNELNMGERPLNWKRSVLLKHLFEISETGYAVALKARWFELRHSGLLTAAHFEEMTAANDRQIHRSVKRNFERWPVDSKWYYDTNTYREEVDLMLKFIDKRIPKLDRWFGRANWP